MARVAVRENTTAEFIRDHVAAGRIVIPANVRHLAGTGGTEARRHGGTKQKGNGEQGTGNGKSHSAHSSEPLGHPRFSAGSGLWVNQTVTQRREWLDDPEYCRGENAPKRLDPCGIGRAITTKINANQGASPVSSDMDEELEKLRYAILYGADTVMDLSTGGNLDECRQKIIDNSVVPIGTVPVYSMIIGRDLQDLTYDDILKTVEQQAKQGVDYFTIHAG
ncbi:MAG: phosphomethylpyrimidine synthase ThiC, partial [Planctomycetes bacterium]|nr:phosphomethylpyrimidine synthase ThiC [Planctomycetota bacterium]